MLVRTTACIRILLATCLLLITAFFSSQVTAQGKGKGKVDSKPTATLVAVYTEGPKANEVRDQIIANLPDGTTPIESAEFRKSLQKAGQKVPAGLVLSVPKQRKAVLTRFGNATEAAAAKGLIIGYSQKKRNGTLEVILLWIPPGASEPTVDKAVPLDKNLKESIGETLRSELSSLEPEPSPVEKDTPKGDEKDKDADKDKEEDEEDDDDKGKPGKDRVANVRGGEIFNVGAGFDMGGRWFKYKDGVTRNLRDYDVFGAPGFSIDAEVYPLTPTEIPVLKDIGVFGGVRLNFLGSATTDSKEVSTAWNRFDVGLRYRLTFTSVDTPDTKLFQIGIRGNLGRDGFVLTTDDAVLQTETPSVAYTFLRPGLDVLVPLGPVYLKVYFDYLAALSKGAVYERFREPVSGTEREISIGGIDLGGGAIVPFGSTGLELRANVEYIRWFYAFKPVVNDPYIAGGALDQNLHLNLGVGYVY